VDQNNVHLSVACSALESQPDYRPDREIADEVERVLWDDDVLHEIACHQTDVVVNAGTVILRGHVRTSTIKERVERAIRSVPSVLGVNNHLVADDALVNAVAQALGHDSRLRGQSVRVQAYQGFITLTGDVRDAGILIAAEAAAASVSQVRGVINHLRAQGVSVNADAQRVVQPRVGQEIFATDGPIGHVEHVVVCPRNRRVTAVVAHGWFADPQHPDQQTVSDVPVRERHVVILIADVHLVTVAEVWLRTSGLEVARGKDVDTTCFVASDVGWQPPYPYSHAEVLLDLECTTACTPGKTTKVEDE
jgi:osmotically-inducible protein OsmY